MSTFSSRTNKKDREEGGREKSKREGKFVRNLPSNFKQFFFVLITKNFLHKEIHGNKFQTPLFLFFRSKLNLPRLDGLFPSVSKQRPLSFGSFQNRLAEFNFLLV
jgi:hypothetical protein